MGWTVLASNEGIYGIRDSIDAVAQGSELLDVVEKGIKSVEDNPSALTVGFNGAPNILGVMECDASVMVGENRLCSSVAALRGIRNPISVARRLLGAMPHVMLAGPGARRFAIETGSEESDLLSNEAQKKYEQWIEVNIPPDKVTRLESAALSPYISFATRTNLSRGTVIFIARSPDGRFAGGVSTTGWAYKYEGRVGDSPIIGAGLYVDDRAGAAACTHTGEMTIRCATSSSVVSAMRRGSSVSEACHDAMKDLCSLTEGYLGPVVIHALNKDGDHYVLKSGGEIDDPYVIWNSDEVEFRREVPVEFKS